MVAIGMDVDETRFPATELFWPSYLDLPVKMAALDDFRTKLWAFAASHWGLGSDTNWFNFCVSI
jgi:hypothetical protein